MNLDASAEADFRETETHDFPVGVGEHFRHPGGQPVAGTGSRRSLTFCHAQNQLTTFRAMKGGRSGPPRFDGEIPSIMHGRGRKFAPTLQQGLLPFQIRRSMKYRKIQGLSSWRRPGVP